MLTYCQLVLDEVVRAPHTTGAPPCWNTRMTLMPFRLMKPWSALLNNCSTPSAPLIVASVPAGALCTPRLLSVRA